MAGFPPWGERKGGCMFITKTDLGQDIYSEILTGVTRANDQNIATACSEAISEINGYLCGRYDTTDLFGKTGTDRNLTVMALARTIVIYKLHKVCNTMSDPRRIDYEDAVSLLGKIQSGKFILEGAKLAGETETLTPSSQVSHFGQTKRENYI